MVRGPAEVIDHSHAGGECLAAARLLVEAVPATKIAWLVLREVKSLGGEIEDVIAVEVLVVVSLREGLHDLVVEVARDGLISPLLKLPRRGGGRLKAGRRRAGRRCYLSPGPGRV